MRSQRCTAALDQAQRLLECADRLSGGGESEQERAERTRLFEVPGACPPYEAAWIRRDKGAILGDICGFYNAFGFEMDPDNATRPDHIAAEFEYLSMLRIMEARALDAGESEKADIALEAYINFLRDHLGDWVSPFCRRLEACTESRAMLDAVDLVKSTWDAAAKAHDLTEFAKLEEFDPLSVPDPIGDDGTPYECLGSGCDTGDAHPGGTVELTSSAQGRPIAGETAQQEE